MLIDISIAKETLRVMDIICIPIACHDLSISSTSIIICRKRVYILRIDIFHQPLTANVFPDAVEPKQDPHAKVPRSRRLGLIYPIAEALRDPASFFVNQAGVAGLKLSE
jgi:hypothetical protein